MWGNECCELRLVRMKEREREGGIIGAETANRHERKKKHDESHILSSPRKRLGKRFTI